MQISGCPIHPVTGESDFAIETCLSALLSAALANLDVESLDFLVPAWRAGCGISQF